MPRWIVAAMVALSLVVAGDAHAQRAAAPAPAAVEIKPPRITGPIDRTLVERTLRRHLRHLEYCYERARLRDPALAGRLRATFRVGERGQIADARVEGVDNALENCAAGIVRRLRFPPGAAEGQVKVDVVLRAPKPPRPGRAKVKGLLASPCLACALGCPCACACPCAALGPGTGGGGLVGSCPAVGPGTGTGVPGGC